jgi:tetratricopeptide (TPR) repeat protein
MTLEPGLVLNERYEIRAALPPAQGRNAFRALDLRLGRDARIQVFNLPLAAEDLPALDRRTHALAGLQDAHLRAFQDVGMLRREGYVVTPWLTGFTLAELAPLPAVRLLGWAEQGAAALAAAHAQGVVHGAVDATCLVEIPGQGVLLQDFQLPQPTAGGAAEDLQALGRALEAALGEAPNEPLQQALAALAEGRMPTRTAPGKPPKRPSPWIWLGGTALALILLGTTLWAGLQFLRPPGLASRRMEAVGEARRLYLEGRHHWNRRNKANLSKAESCLRQAIALDPTYAEAYVALAECQALAAVFGNGSSEETVRRTRETLRELARVDPANREAPVVEAYLLFRYEHRWKEAEAMFRKGLEPGAPSTQDPTRLHWFGFFLSCLGRHDEAITWLERAVAQEPLNLQARTNLAVALAWANRREEALRIFDEIQELDPHFTSATDRLRSIHESWGNLEQSLQLAESLDPSETTRALREAFTRRGARGFWEARLREYQTWERTHDGDPYFVAYPQAALGNRDAAFVALDKALARNSPYLVWAPHDPALAALHADPRFREFLRRLNLE